MMKTVKTLKSIINGDKCEAAVINWVTTWPAFQR